jgi:hypothetical protein
MKFANTLQERIYSSTPNPKKSQLILNLKPIENSPINSREREREREEKKLLLLASNIT